MRSLPVLYQDEQLVAVNKPSGLLVHRSAIDRYETEIAMTILRDQLGQWVYPLHRLDKSTSGALVFALDRETARALTRAFTDAKVSKKYLAVVRGFTGEGERIDHPLKDRHDERARGEENGDRTGKRSVTDYRRLATVELPQPVGRYATARYSFVAAAPLTGRTHQIRRHLKHIFHPIVGDTTYGDGKQNDFFRRTFNCHRLLLHASAIEFIHPGTGRLLSIHAPLDREFRAVLEALQWDKVEAV